MVELAYTPLKLFGAEIEHDLHSVFTTETKDALRRVFAEYRWLLFRGQRLTRAQQEQLVGVFGPIAPVNEEIPIISNKGDAYALGDTELAFHTELSYAPEPYISICLHALNVEEDRTSTKFTDGVQLWANMPKSLQEKVKDVRVRNYYALDVSRRDPTRVLDKRLPQTEHPLVRIHTTSGKTYLFISQLETMEVVGLDRPASEEFLNELFDYCYQPQHVLEHVWRNNDVVIWDNMPLQHARGAVGKGERTLQRVASIRCTFPQQFPDFKPGYVDGSVFVLVDSVTPMKNMPARAASQ
jgi:taurine dioxygenase